jgi:ABC-type polysaccharide/polyol phosphate transport system ATPase subunit
MRSNGQTPFAVTLDGVSKSYNLAGPSQWAVKDAILRPLRVVRQLTAKRPFWALKDITLQVPHGQILGIIGPNGSGKSSLLRILAGISPPSSGSVHIDGSYGALLELGAGFHPGVTGRQNAYLNALFMGLSKAEANAALPAIIEFSELGDFIDQPMRTYSSGMYLRLGFSVAIHVHPDILIVDEVLAVGDASFQEKCFAHFRGLKERGITVVLVTHNLDTLVTFADRVVMLEHGEVKHDGDPEDVVAKYIQILADNDPAMRQAYDRAVMGRIVDQALRDNLDGDAINELLSHYLARGPKAAETAGDTEHERASTAP